VPDSGFAAAARGRLDPLDDDDLAAVEAFAPATAEEAAAEDRVEADLRRADRRRILVALLGVVGLAAVAGGGVALFQSLGEDGGPRRGGLVFADPSDAATGDDGLGPPVVEPLLVVLLTTVVAVGEGEGPPEARVDPAADPAVAPVAPGTVAATVLARDGEGQVLLTGPDGWLGSTCIRASVVAGSLQPFDTVWFETADGACGAAAIGRPVRPTCLGPAAVMLPLRIPAGGAVEADLGMDEEAVADAVRVAVVGVAPGFSEISVRGTIAVPEEEAGVRIPAFGGEPGTPVEVALGGAGAGLVASCTLS
jgi:hypothetical protein